jgi:thiol-disulfide isomerase/thioredoxin
MKKLFIFITVAALASCTGKGPANVSTLSGKVNNNPNNFVLLTEGRTADTITLGEDGNFSFTKEIEKPGSYYLQANKKYAIIYLEPGKNLEINFDATAFDSTLTFAGDLALENKYNVKINKLNREIAAKSRTMYVASPEEYHEAVTADRQAREKLMADFMESNPGMSKNFIESEKMSYEFLYYGSLLNFETYHKYYAKVDTFELPADWYSFMDNIDLNNEKYLDIPACMNVVSGIVDKKIEESTDLGDDAWGTPALLTAQFDWITKNITNPAVADHFMYSYLTSVVDYTGPSGIENFIDIYNEKSNNTKNIEELAKKVEEWAPLAPGMPAPEFTLPDINGNEVSLADFKGKYVYIDFWATWCGPCKIEIPALAKLVKQYSDKNIVIMSISVDRDKQAWVDMLTRDKPEWLQLHDGIMMNDNYLVKFIPTFVLIDRDGNILNPRAPRPSSGEKLTSLLDSLEGI